RSIAPARPRLDRSRRETGPPRWFIAAKHSGVSRRAASRLADRRDGFATQPLDGGGRSRPLAGSDRLSYRCHSRFVGAGGGRFAETRAAGASGPYVADPAHGDVARHALPRGTP